MPTVRMPDGSIQTTATRTTDRVALTYSPKRRRSGDTRTHRQRNLDAERALIDPLERCIANIRHKMRETPAWATAYASAITTIELEIQRLRA